MYANLIKLFNEVCTEAQDRDEKVSLLYIDIDHFKKVNDTYGHVEGDQVLVELSHILTSTVRSFDHVSRNGGEEFTVILLDCPAQRAEEISERIRKKVQNHAFQLATGESISITVSIGIACYDETTNTPQLLIEEADQALYEAKQSGRNQVCLSHKFAGEHVIKLSGSLFLDDPDSFIFYVKRKLHPRVLYVEHNLS